MDDAERIPIDLGYEVAGEAAASEPGERFAILPDGTLAIGAVPQPCAAEPTTDEQILVCAAAPQGERLGRLPRPETQSPMEILAEAFSAAIGPVEINPSVRPDNTVGIGLRIRF